MSYRVLVDYLGRGINDVTAENFEPYLLGEFDDREAALAECRRLVAADIEGRAWPGCGGFQRESDG